MNDQPNIDRPVNMYRARKAFAVERKTAAPTLGSFRDWARRTYSPTTCTGKLARLVGGKAKKR